MQTEQTAPSLPSTERRILGESRSACRWLYSATGMGFVAAAFFVAQAWLLSVVVNRVFLQSQTLAEVWPWFGLMLALLVMRGAFIWISDVMAQRGSSRIKARLRERLTSRLLALGPAYTQGERSGELVNTVVGGVEALDDYFTQYLPARFLAGLVPALVLLIVLLLDPWTTLVLMVAGPFLILLLALIGGRTKEITERRFRELGWLSAHFLDMLQGLPTLKLFGRSREQAANIETISRQYGDTTMEVLRTAFQTSLVMEWAATAATALIALEVSLRLMNGVLPFERALAVLLLTPEFFIPLRQMALRYHAGTEGKTAAKRIYTILDLPAPGPVPASPIQCLAVLPARYDIAFEDVSFAYEGGQRPALRRLSLNIPEGKTVALVGPSGAGKTTVANLLLRFIRPDSGSIYAGGIPLQDIEPAAWRRQVAWVSQAPYLFHGTVAGNIQLARPEAGMAEVIAAARVANAHEFITALPCGYDTAIGEHGMRLSGGQRQRLAIARAILKGAPLLILDEATVHLDAASEALIQEALERLLRGRTVLIIAHRLNMAFRADQVVVLDEGRAVESGSHSDLLASGGMYRQLVMTNKAGPLPEGEAA